MSTPFKSYYEKIEEKKCTFEGVLLKLDNAVLAFCYSNGNPKLGTLAVAMPQFGGKTYVSSILLGERNMIITKILAEHVASTFNCIALVSNHSPKIEESEASLTLLKLINKLLDKAGLKKLSAQTS